MASKGKINMGKYMPTQKDFDAMQWCIANNIKISPMAKSTYEWYIDIEINNKKNRSPYVYVKDQIWQEIWKFYKYYYKKYEK
jgi:HD superfamily phosphohydrolase